VPKSWTDGAPQPVALQEHAHVKDPLSYKIKRRLLGNPLNRHTLGNQRLGKRYAFGILSSDCISSSAYGGEQILVALIPAFGLAAFTIFPPLTGVILFMLLIITFSYRDVIGTYTKSGSAYVVARENFGKIPSQVAAIELMFGYIITVAIQSAAGVAAVISIFPEIDQYKVVISCAIVFILTYVNLRGVKEAGIVFVIPSYLFIGTMLLVFIAGFYRFLNGTLPTYSLSEEGLVDIGQSQGLISFAAFLFILRAFANGSASLTGIEAISDSVPIFKQPEHENARKVLIYMSLTLATLILGISWLAKETQAIPHADGTPTVISLVAKAALGENVIGTALYFLTQLGTMLILFAGANTCFSAFPNMVNTVSKDGYLPNRLGQRGHRLVFSNGIIFIALGACILIVSTKASITVLAAIYALSVFIGFSLTSSGMTKRSFRDSSNKINLKVILHAGTAIISIFTVVVLSVIKFAEGTWVVVIGTPIVVAIMLHLNRQYEQEKKVLFVPREQERATTIVRHNVSVLIDKVDLATVGAIRYARSLKPRELTAVHFVIDDRQAEEIRKAWASSEALDDVTLELIDCPDRRLANSALDYAIRMTERNDVELTLLLPRRSYSGFLGRLLHDQTAEEIAAPISQLQRVVATIVPFDVDRITSGSQIEFSPTGKAADGGAKVKIENKPIRDFAATEIPVGHYAENLTPISEIKWRKRAHVQGQVTAIKNAPSGSAPILQVEVWDPTGGVTLHFLGRREIAGLEVGTQIRAEGMVGEEEGVLTILNPSYELLV
jgi:amino acid transporter|tara:strand:+ start:30236 stop:32578 length:2343 start_codon:yes stop_codon:yes gene_type:complete